MAAAKEVKKKISSVQSTKKITSAMELVAASKMRRTQRLMRASRPYADKIREVIGHLAGASPEYRNDYMQVPEVERIGYIVVSTDRGLCGGLNVNLLRVLVRDMQEWHERDVESELALIGNKAVTFFRSFGASAYDDSSRATAKAASVQPPQSAAAASATLEGGLTGSISAKATLGPRPPRIAAAFTHFGEKPAIKDLIGGIGIMLKSYAEGRIDKLMIISNEYLSTMVQRPVLRQLLPLKAEDTEVAGRRWDYLYEPEARELVEGLVQRFIEAQVYEAVIENIACEQASKMVAMKNATQNAEEMIDELTLLYNNARQAAITREIAEIVGGADAV